MPKINIVKSTHIDAPVEKVFNNINDFNDWVKWSPWLIMEPEVDVNIAADNKSYSWEGKRTGSGNMKVLNEVENKSIEYDLNFLKPWKSHAKVKFVVSPSGNGTDVSWHMDSSLPFFMFFMKKPMETYVGMDYERGLRLLKDYVEDGKIHSQLNFIGESQHKGTKYIGIRTRTTQTQMGEKMQADFGKLWAAYQGSDVLNQADSFSIYHKFDAVKDKIEYTAGMPVDSIPASLPDGFISGEIPASKVYTLEHVGPYDHLGNAWSTMQTMLRGKEIKPIKGIHPWETYHNNPADTDPKELITRIHFAVK